MVLTRAAAALITDDYEGRRPVDIVIIGRKKILLSLGRQRGLGLGIPNFCERHRFRASAEAIEYFKFDLFYAEASVTSVIMLIIYILFSIIMFTTSHFFCSFTYDVCIMLQLSVYVCVCVCVVLYSVSECAKGIKLFHRYKSISHVN